MGTRIAASTAVAGDAATTLRLPGRRRETLGSSGEHLTYANGEALTGAQWTRRCCRRGARSSGKAVGQVHDESCHVGNRKLERLRALAFAPDARIRRAGVEVPGHAQHRAAVMDEELPPEGWQVVHITPVGSMR